MNPTDTKEVGFADKYTATLALTESLSSIVVITAQDHAAAKDKCKTANKLRDELAAEYKVHPVIIEAKRLQGIKVDLDAKLEAFVKGLKNGPMLTYEKIEEEKRLAEERRIAAEIKKRADEEARIAAEAARKESEKARKIAEAAQKKADEEAAARAEAARKEADAARKRADAARKRGDEEAAAKAEAARKEAEVKRKAEEEARKVAEAEAAEKAEAARKEAEAEQARIKEAAIDAASVTVVVEKTAPTASRRKVYKFRIKDAEAVKPEYQMPDEVKIGKVVRALGKPAEAAVGGIEVYEDLV